MDFLTAADLTHKNGETTRYYEGGSKDGIPLIFIHGWPDIAQIWHHQLRHFSGTSYRALALDMRGYGSSTSPRSKRAYSLQALASELVDFAQQLHIGKAVWIGHDWGSGVINALAAHHPELFLGLAVLAVPYRTIELGVDYMISLVNRDIYPEEEYPYGQWEYMVCYNRHTEESVKAWESVPIERISKSLYVRYKPERYGKPAHTSRTLRDGWFGGSPERTADVPLEATTLDESLYKNLMESHRKHGWFPAVAYYLNSDVNAEYAKSEVNGGVLEFPVLFIEARHDAPCAPSTTPKIGESQRAATKDLTHEVIESAHWVQLEKPQEVNAALEKWLNKTQTPGAGSQR